MVYSHFFHLSLAGERTCLVLYNPLARVAGRESRNQPYTIDERLALLRRQIFPQAAPVCLASPSCKNSAKRSLSTAIRPGYISPCNIIKKRQYEVCFRPEKCNSHNACGNPSANAWAHLRQSTLDSASFLSALCKARTNTYLPTFAGCQVCPSPGVTLDEVPSVEWPSPKLQHHGITQGS